MTHYHEISKQKVGHIQGLKNLLHSRLHFSGNYQGIQQAKQKGNKNRRAIQGDPSQNKSQANSRTRKKADLGRQLCSEVSRPLTQVRSKRSRGSGKDIFKMKLKEHLRHVVGKLRQLMQSLSQS